MASKRGFKAGPSVGCNSHPTTPQIQHSAAPLYTVETPQSYHNQTPDWVLQFEELEECVSLDNEADVLTRLPRPNRYAFPREEMSKRCQWFDSAEELVDTNATLSPSRMNQPKLSPKQVYRRMKPRGQLSNSPISTLESDEKECISSPGKPLAATQRICPTVFPVCLPPGCVPPNVTVQLTRGETQPRTEVEVTMQCDEELDCWLEDICQQMILEKPHIMSSGIETEITIVHDLADVLSQNVGSSEFNCFHKSRKAPLRRNAICEELEMLIGLVKVNGAKFSLWHLRKEFVKTLKLRKL